MNGYVMRTSPPNVTRTRLRNVDFLLVSGAEEVVDTVEHPGLDKVRLSYDFQERWSGKLEALRSAIRHGW